ncbi:MAG: replication initiator protein A [Eubacteriaceae bacterium]|nr:replication initiator protein A [Eubacteriaceae bacterium]
MGFDYFYNREAERFLFYRIPHVFFEEPKFKALSSDVKILYALFFHRITLSLKKGWIDEYGRVYIIVTFEEIQEKFGCSNKTAMKIMAELDGNTGGEEHAATILPWYLKDKGNEKKSAIPTIEEYDKGEHL